MFNGDIDAIKNDPVILAKNMYYSIYTDIPTTLLISLPSDLLNLKSYFTWSISKENIVKNSITMIDTFKRL